LSQEINVYDEKLKHLNEKELIKHLVLEIDTFLATGIGRDDRQYEHHLQRLARAAGTTSRELIRREREGIDVVE
jgi:hypothetical protein